MFLSARGQPTSFAAEAGMTKVAAEVAAASWWRSPEQLDFVATEIVGPGAIADIVATSFDKAVVRKRLEQGIAPLTDWSAIVCASCCADASTVSEVIDYTGLSRSGASRSLGLAVEHRALVRDGRRFVIDDAWQNPVRCVVAAELKLRDWQKGANQAGRYRRWADASWLILGATSTLDGAKAALPKGVGLLRLTPEGQVQRARVAQRRRPTVALERIWIAEQILKQSLASGWRPEVTAPAASLAGVAAFA